MSTVGDILSTTGGYHDTCGGYREYRGDVQYRGDIIFCYLSTSKVQNTHGSHDIPPQYSNNKR